MSQLSPEIRKQLAAIKKKLGALEPTIRRTLALVERNPRAALARTKHLRDELDGIETDIAILVTRCTDCGGSPYCKPGCPNGDPYP